jgi:hypothetical protein
MRCQELYTDAEESQKNYMQILATSIRNTSLVPSRYRAISRAGRVGPVGV